MKHGTAVSSICVHDDKIISGSDDGTIKVWDTEHLFESQRQKQQKQNLFKNFIEKGDVKCDVTFDYNSGW